MSTTAQKTEEIITTLKSMTNEYNRAGMKRFGINTEHAFGVSVTELRKLGKPFKKDHELALSLFATGYHEARILAIVIDDPKKVTTVQMEEWVQQFDSWDVTDLSCMHLFVYHPDYMKTVLDWCNRTETFQKRAGFTMIAAGAVHLKKHDDQMFADLLPLTEQHAYDERNFVKKAVNWGIRQIGKRSHFLRDEAIACCERILLQGTKPARWIANDALKELHRPEIIARIKR